MKTVEVNGHPLGGQPLGNLCMHVMFAKHPVDVSHLHFCQSTDR